MKSFLTTPQFEIISALLGEEKPKTLADLSKTLNISPRKIQYNLNPIEAWLNSCQVSLDRRSGVGIFINLPIEEKQTLLNQLANLVDVELVLTRSQRQRLLLIRLLLANTPLSSSELADEYCVTRATLLKDLDYVKSVLDQYNLTLPSIPREGHAIVCHPSIRRFLIAKSFCEEHLINNTSLRNLEVMVTLRPPFHYLFGNPRFQEDLKFSAAAIDDIEISIDEKLSQAGYVFLLYYLLFLLDDVRKNIQIDDIEIEEFENLRDVTFVHNFNSLLERYVGNELSDSEIQLLTLHVACLPRSIQPDGLTQMKRIEENFPFVFRRLEGICAKFIKEISLYLNPYLNVDIEFHDELVQFFEKSVLAKKYGFSLIFPVENNAFCYEENTLEIVERILRKTTRLTKFNYQELCALTSLVIANSNRVNQGVQKDLRVILVNNSDYSVSSIMRDRIKENFPWFHIVDTLRPIDVKQNRLRKVDLVISTDNIECEDTPPVILVDPFVPNQDIDLIHKEMAEYTKQLSKSIALSGSLGISDLLIKENISLVEHIESWQNAVLKAGKPLVRRGSIDGNYLEEIIQSNIDHGPYSVVAPHIALMHSKPTIGVRELCLGLLVVNQGVVFGMDEYDPVHLLFLLAIPGVLTHINALEDLIKIIQNQEICQTLLECRSRTEIRRKVIENLESRS